MAAEKRSLETLIKKTLIYFVINSMYSSASGQPPLEAICPPNQLGSVNRRNYADMLQPHTALAIIPLPMKQITCLHGETSCDLGRGGGLLDDF